MLFVPPPHNLNKNIIRSLQFVFCILPPRTIFRNFIFYLFICFLYSLLLTLTLGNRVRLLLIYVRTDSWNAWIRLSNTHSITRIACHFTKSPSCVSCVCFCSVHFHLFFCYYVFCYCIVLTWVCVRARMRRIVSNVRPRIEIQLKWNRRRIWQ